MTQSAYIEYKDEKDLETKINVLFGSQNVLFYVWRTVRGLKRNTSFSGDDYVGAYVAYPYRKPRSGLFGEVHLVKSRIGAGYVAHEIQHFIYDWLMEQKQSTSLNERTALLAGDVTRDFWSQYYEKGNV